MSDQSDQFCYFSTVTIGGAPMPLPVWFVPDPRDDGSLARLTIYTARESHRAQNLLRGSGRCSVLLHGDAAGHGFQAWTARGYLSDGAPSRDEPYVAKYADAIADLHERYGMPSLDEYDATFNTKITVVRTGTVRTM